MRGDRAWFAGMCLLLVASAGCATLQVNGSTQRIAVESTPSGAQVVLNGDAVGRTPLDVEVRRRDAEVDLRVEKAGFNSQERSLQRSWSSWLLCDVALGMFLGFYALLGQSGDDWWTIGERGPTLSELMVGAVVGASPVLLDLVSGAAFAFPDSVEAHLTKAVDQVGRSALMRQPMVRDRALTDVRRIMARAAAATVVPGRRNGPARRTVAMLRGFSATGAPFRSAVDVYRLAAPVVEPVVEPEREPPCPRSRRASRGSML